MSFDLLFLANKAKDFAEIYTIIAKEPFEKISPKLLRKLLADPRKRVKVTNVMMTALREKVRAEII